MVTTRKPLFSNFERALAWTRQEDGGWSNHPADDGGPTNHGITQRTYDAWRNLKKLPRQSVRAISAEEVNDIYLEMFWQEASCDEFAWPLCLVVFDTAVQRGPETTIRKLQGFVGAKQDGDWGPRSWAALQKFEEYRAGCLMILDRLALRKERCQEDAAQWKNLHGWVGRDIRLWGIVQEGHQ